MLRKSLILISISYIVLSGITCYADDVTRLKAELSSCSNQIVELQDQIQVLDNDIQTTYDEQIKLEERIKYKESEIIELDSEIKRIGNLRDARLREFYKSGNINLEYIKLLFSCDSFSELYNTTTRFQTLIKNDKSIIDSYSQILNTYQEELSNLETMRNDNKDLIELLNGKKAEQSLLLSNYNQNLKSITLRINVEHTTQIDKLMKDSESLNSPSELQIVVNSLEELKPSIINPEVLSHLQDAIAKLNARIESLIVSNSQQPSVNRGFTAGLVPPETQNKIINEAYKYLGIPYLWGGTDPSKGLDCSGFVQLVYHNLGYNISRTTYTQISDGKYVEVSLNSLQPGDLIFFGIPSAPHHVALYIGDNKYIHAPQTGDVVKVSEGALRACCARRIIQ